MIGLKDYTTLAAEEAEFTRRWAADIFAEETDEGDTESWEEFCARELSYIDRLP